MAIHSRTSAATTTEASSPRRRRRFSPTGLLLYASSKLFASAGPLVTRWTSSAFQPAGSGRARRFLSQRRLHVEQLLCRFQRAAGCLSLEELGRFFPPPRARRGA
ncbi:unnamed protein product [Heligmosomoides polygyrus]|uniref:Uncharacterized protein n=1 Tax=Heligmosomoides polygyrus TaxID=6339 RepID=A0A183FXQ3_HELPZ|nr:unnamed protein product [Heligmosomoides polygyrus]